MKKILYSNYIENLTTIEEAMEILEEMGEEKTEENAYNLIHETSACDFEDFIYSMKKLLEDKYYIATGTCGLWYGKVEGGKVIVNINDFYSLLQDCDYFEFSEENGRFLIKCSHHDGTNYYELRELNNKGINYYQDKGYSLDRRELCERLFKPAYSKLPRLFKEIYGC